jgi:hypothetical protein
MMISKKYTIVTCCFDVNITFIDYRSPVCLSKIFATFFGIDLTSR